MSLLKMARFEYVKRQVRHSPVPIQRFPGLVSVPASSWFHEEVLRRPHVTEAGQGNQALRPRYRRLKPKALAKALAGVTGIGKIRFECQCLLQKRTTLCGHALFQPHHPQPVGRKRSRRLVSSQ